MPILSSFGGASIRGFNPGGGDTSDWADLQTGDPYQGGVINRTANTMAVWYYPSSRKTTGLNPSTYPPANLTGGSFEVRGQSNIQILGVGGGAGGRGNNSHAGGGGGSFGTSFFSVSDGDTFSITVGAGGVGGVHEPSSPDISYLGSSNNNSTDGGTTRITRAGVLDLQATGGTVGNRTSNTTSAGDLGQGGTGSTITNNTGASIAHGTGGRGGGRNFAPNNGTNGGAGAGGGNTSDDPDGYDDGSDGSASSNHSSNNAFSGGGGGGSAPGAASLRPGGSGAGNGSDGGLGGSTSVPTFGQNGGGVSGGRAYIQADAASQPNVGNNWNRGSAGGGGWPGGGGGSSWYGGPYDTGELGLGADGAAGVIEIKWNLT